MKKYLVGLVGLAILFGGLWNGPPLVRACPSGFQDVTNSACRVNVVAGSITVTSAPSTNTFTSATAVFATVTNVIATHGVIVSTGTNTIGAVLQGTTPWAVNGSVAVATAQMATGSNVIGYVGQSGVWNIASITGAPLAVNCTGCAAASVVTATVTNASVTIVACAVGVCATPGQTTMASSTSVTMANDQSAISMISTSVALATGTNSIGIATANLAGIARTTLPTAGADGTRIGAMTDKFGRLVVVPHGDRALATITAVTIATTVETALTGAGGSGVFIDLTHLSCSNTSSATATRVDIRDATAGTVRYSMMLAGNGGGFVAPFVMPFPQVSGSNANWTAQLSVNVTDVRCQLVGILNK